MPYKDPKNPKNVAYKRAYHLKTKDDPKRKKARKENYKRWRKKNRLQYNAYMRSKYNPEKAKAWWQKVKEREHERCNKKTELLTEAYMIKHLKKLGYTHEQIVEYPELINTYKLIIKTKRLWKASSMLKNLEKV